MRKVEVSVEGLRILRTEAECRLHEWAQQQAAGGSGAAPEPTRQAHLREAVREANDRLASADAQHQGQGG